MSKRQIIKGTNFGFMAKRGYYRNPDVLGEIPKMIEMGIEWVAVHVVVMQTQWCSTRLYQDFEYTVDDFELEFFIKELHRNNLKVILRPVVECLDSVPRKDISFPKDDDGHIQGILPKYWQQWFKSFSFAMTYYGYLAERMGCEMFSLSCEMYKTEDQEKLWQKLIKEVKKIYSGLVVYDTSINSTKAPEWFHLLDQIHFSYYGGGTFDKLNEDANFLKKFSEKYNDKPIVFGECGFLSTSHNQDKDNLRLPGHNRYGIYNGEVQAKKLNAILEHYWDEPWWNGMLFWKWDETQDRPNYHSDPSGDQGFTVTGKPAADIIKKWYKNQESK